jgi:hypothetical protein
MRRLLLSLAACTPLVIMHGAHAQPVSDSRDSIRALANRSFDERRAGLLDIVSVVRAGSDAPDARASRLLRLAQIAAAWGIHDVALEAAGLARVDARHPGLEAASSVVLAEGYWAQRRLSLADDALAEALAAADTLTGEARTSARAGVLLATARIKQGAGQTGAAIEARRQLVANLPAAWTANSKSGAFSNLARLLLAAGQSREGLEAFEHAAKIELADGDLVGWTGFKSEALFAQRASVSVQTWLADANRLLDDQRFAHSERGLAVTTHVIARMPEAGLNVEQQIQAVASRIDQLRPWWNGTDIEFQKKNVEAWLVIGQSHAMLLESNQQLTEALNALNTVLAEVAPFLGQTEHFQDTLQKVAASMERRLGLVPRLVEPEAHPRR